MIPNIFAASWLDGWQNREAITIKTQSLGLSADVTGDTTILVDINSDNADFWAAYAGQTNQDIIDELRFTSSDGATLLLFDLADVNIDTSHVQAWVRVTETKYKDNNLLIYMYFSNVAATAYGQGKLAYQNDIMANWHLESFVNASVGLDIGGATDSTDRNNDMNNYNVAGRYVSPIGFGYNYNGTTARSDVLRNTGYLMIPGNLTLSQWLYLDSNTGAITLQSQKDGGGSTTYALYARDSSSCPKGIVFVSAGVLPAKVCTNINSGEWTHLTFVRDQNNNPFSYLHVYKNGVDVNTVTYDGTYPKNWPNYPFNLMGSVAGNWTAGKVDEYRVYNTAKTADQVKVIYASDSKQLISFGTKETATGVLTINTKDEKTWADITNVVLTIGATSYTLINASTDINFANYAPGNYNLMFSKDGYTTRNYQFYFNGQSLTINMLLDKIETSLFVDFNFIAPVTRAPFLGWATIDKQNPTTFEYWTIGSYLTNEFGEASIYIDNNDQRYRTRLYNSYGTSYYIYPVLLTVNNPKDEITDANIDANWNIGTSNTHNYYWSSLNAPKDIYVIPNTVDYMFINIDSNSPLLYLPRTYFVRYDSDDATVSTTHDYLTPYLPLSVSVGDNVNFITKSKTRDTIKYVDFFVYKTINGIKYQIMAGRTDVTGSRLFPFIQGENYEIQVIKDGVIYEDSYLYTATETPVYWYIDLGTNTIGIQQYFIPTNITFTPNGPKLVGTDTTITVAMAADDISQYSYMFYQYNDINMMTGIKIFTQSGAACSGSSCAAVIAIPAMDTNKQFFFDFNMSYNNGDTNEYITKVYSKTVYSNLDVFRLAFAVRKDFGCTTNANDICALGIGISVLITLVVVFALSAAVGVFHGFGVITLSMLMLGVFTFIGWFFWPMYLFLVAGAILAGASGFMRKGDN